jgi:hypothetical protein
VTVDRRLLVLSRGDVARLGFPVGCRPAIALREAGFDASSMAGGHYAWKAMGGKVRLLEGEKS